LTSLKTNSTATIFRRFLDTETLASGLPKERQEESTERE
jgi:hypothetical protein